MGSEKEVKALNNYVFFKIKIEKQTKSGIVIPIDEQNPKKDLAKHTMEVISVGQDVKNVEAGDVIIVWPNTWMKIPSEIYTQLTGKKVDEGETCGVVKEEHITSKVN